MCKLISAEFNMDTACVEARFSDGAKIAVDCAAVEAALDANTLQCGELDWMIHNKPLEYLQMVFSGELDAYIKGTAEHRLNN